MARIAVNRVELALALGMSTDEIDRMVSEGVLPNARRWGKKKLWLVGEIEIAIANLPYEGRQPVFPHDDDWIVE